MSETDLPLVLNIQAQSYRSEFLESETAFAEKLALFPEGCWLGSVAAEPAAYLFSHPWSQTALVELGVPLRALPTTPDCYYVHDVAVSARFRGCGLGPQMFRKAQERAQEYHLTPIMLVAVQGSQKFWTKLGFEPVVKPSETMTATLRAYGAQACVMVRS